MAEQDGSLWERFDGATSILLLTPPRGEPDQEACIDLLTPDDPRDRNVLSVTLSQTPDERFDIWERHVGNASPKRGIIIAANDATAPNPGSSRVADTSIEVTALPDPTDTTALVAEIARHLGRWEESPDPTSICVHSLTALLDRFPASEVVRMIAALDSTFRSMDIVGHYHLNPDACEEGTLAEIRQLFDVVVEHTPGGEWAVTRPDADPPLLRNGEDGIAVEADRGSPPAADLNLSRSFDTVIDLFAAPQRRAVLYYFVSTHDEAVDLDALSAWIQTIAPRIGDRDWGESERNLELSLLHVHLPKLEEAGAIEFDRETETVRYSANPALERSIELARGAEDV